MAKMVCYASSVVDINSYFKQDNYRTQSSSGRPVPDGCSWHFHFTGLFPGSHQNNGELQFEGAFAQDEVPNA